MGLRISKVYFEKGLPSVEEIRQQFQKQTGLDIYIRSDLNLLELPLNNKNVVEQLHKDIDKYEALTTEKIVSQKFENRLEEMKKINHIGNFFQFYHPSFYGITFQIEKNTIILRIGVGLQGVTSFYFLHSLEKSLFDLGGVFIGIVGKEPINYSPKIWKKLKPWRDYKWYNRPKK